MTDRIDVRGIGWIDGSAYGCVGRDVRILGRGKDPLRSLWKGEEYFSYPIKNFGRFDRLSRLACGAVALAAKDAGIEYGEGRKQGLGLLGTNPEGSLRGNIAYFDDYVRCGRTLGRGNLFLYTLPSSPLAEAAVHFGFQGPVLYVGGPDGALGDLMTAAAGMVRRGEAPAVLVLDLRATEAVCLALAPESGESRVCGLSEARRVVGDGMAPAQVVAGFQKARAEAKP